VRHPSRRWRADDYGGETRLHHCQQQTRPDAGWDEEVLTDELKEHLTRDFDVGVTCFTISEFDGPKGGVKPEKAGDPAENAPPDDDGAAPMRGGRKSVHTDNYR
jgi:hypothetical protein